MRSPATSTGRARAAPALGGGAGPSGLSPLFPPGPLSGALDNGQLLAETCAHRDEVSLSSSKQHANPAAAAGKKILDVGCGQHKYPGAIGLDSNPKTAADVIHDLGGVPYPFPDNQVDEVIGTHVVEHVPDVMAFISERHRITKPGGRLTLLT